jgi:uncharacterized protein
MLLSLRSLSGAHAHVDKQLAPGLFETTEEEPFRVVSPISLSFDVDAQEAGRYRVAGHLGGDLELTCSRCLERFRLSVSSEFDLRYVPRVENAGEGEQEVDEDDLTTAYYADDQIDLKALVMEQLHLALPMKPLCDPECKGLCAECGTNWNTGICSCTPRWTDPRLDVLKKLR